MLMHEAFAFRLSDMADDHSCRNPLPIGFRINP